MNYWKRYIDFTIGLKKYTAPIAMDFKNSFSIKGSDSTTAHIYNPSKETIESVEPKAGLNQTIAIDAGYEDDHGLCVFGEIYEFSVNNTGIDRILEMKIHDSTTKWANTRVSKTWPENTKASTVIKDLTGIFGLDLGKTEVGADKVFPRGVSFNVKLKKALEQMAKETGSDFFLRNSRLYFQSALDKGIKTGVILNEANGLIGRPESRIINNEARWIIKSLFNYKIGPGELIRVESKDFSEDCKVISGNHSYTDAKAYTEMEVVKI